MALSNKRTSKVEADRPVAVEVEVSRHHDRQISADTWSDQLAECMGSHKVTPFTFMVDRRVVWAD